MTGEDMKAALLSRWHVHAAANDGRYVKEFLSHPENKVVCVWDKNAETASEWGREFDCDWETDLEAVLSRSDVEGVIVTSEPALHKEIFIAAAQHKKHIFTLGFEIFCHTHCGKCTIFSHQR